MSYFHSLLVKYLYDYFPELLNEEDFISSSAAMAAATYQEVIEKGYDVNTALEYAQNELFSGLGFSRFGCLMEVVEENFPNEIPEDKRRDFCTGIISESEAVFQKYQVQNSEDSQSEKIRMNAELIALIESTLKNGLP